MTDGPLDIAALEALEAKATPRPWSECKDGKCSCGFIFGDSGKIYIAKLLTLDDDCDPVACAEGLEANGALITALRNAAPALIAAAKERDELRAEIARMREAIKMAEAALLRCHHELTTLNNLRATDLTISEFDKFLASGTLRENIEWMTDTSSVLHRVDNAILAITAALKETTHD